MDDYLDDRRPYLSYALLVYLYLKSGVCCCSICALFCFSSVNKTIKIEYVCIYEMCLFKLFM